MWLEVRRMQRTYSNSTRADLFRHLHGLQLEFDDPVLTMLNRHARNAPTARTARCVSISSRALLRPGVCDRGFACLDACLYKCSSGKMLCPNYCRAVIRRHAVVAAAAERKTMMMWEALREALDEEMERDPAVCLMGELQAARSVPAEARQGRPAAFLDHAGQTITAETLPSCLLLRCLIWYDLQLALLACPPASSELECAPGALASSALPCCRDSGPRTTQRGDPAA